MKKRKKLVSVIAIILVVLMLMSLIAGVFPIIAHADEEYDQTLSTLKAARNAVSNKLSDVNARIDDLKDKESAVIEQKMALEERNEFALNELELIDKELELYGKMIEQKAKELEIAENREEVQLQKYRTRVRAMEENGNYNILTLILNSNDFTELLGAVDDFGEVMQSDRVLADQYEAAREETEEIKQEYEEYEAEVQEKQAELQLAQQELEAQIEESKQLLEELAEAIEEAEEEKRKAEEAEAAAAASISDFIRSYQQKKAEQQAQAAQEQTQQNNDVQQGGLLGETGGNDGFSGGSDNNAFSGGGATGTGSFSWPVPSTQRVSSCYKTRQGRQHAGIDIDGFGLDGSPVVAADGGTVILATYSGGYGNCVIIDHGNGYTTVYAHLSGFAVSQGAGVSKGQTVGYLGSTGNSTGTHLHFEVRSDGSTTDPLQFFSGYELEPGAADES